MSAPLFDSLYKYYERLTWFENTSDAIKELRTVEVDNEQAPACECGAEKSGSGGHSPWCPKFEGYK